MLTHTRPAWCLCPCPVGGVPVGANGHNWCSDSQNCSSLSELFISGASERPLLLEGEPGSAPSPAGVMPVTCIPYKKQNYVREFV